MSTETKTDVTATLGPQRIESTALDLISPIYAQSLFWKANYLQDSKLLCHLPVFFLLFSLLRPRRYVEIDMTEAVSYFAACQAVERLGTHAVCRGFWHQGAEPKPIPENVASHNQEKYSEFSKIFVAPSGEAAAEFWDASVDMLLVNLWSGSENVGIHIQDWLPKLSNRSVILLNGMFRPDAGKRADIGLLRILEERCPCAHFEEADGLTVLLWGDERNELLQRLADLDPDSAARMNVIRVLSRLGAAHQAEWTAHHALHQNRNIHIENAELHINNENLRNALTQQVKITSEQSKLISIIQSQYHDMKEAFIKLRNAAEVGAAEADAKLTTQTRALEAARSEVQTLRADRQSRDRTQGEERVRLIQERTELSERLETREAELTTRLSEADAKLATLEKALEAARSEGEAQQAKSNTHALESARELATLTKAFEVARSEVQTLRADRQSRDRTQGEERERQIRE